ncbi:MAG: 1-(5-phosphoribosyl)-5-[Desulfovibrionaceae bacterium]|nr:1-(5-phosphoribosyl)-5-[(5-phosphoribosylamino)methylideneamino]imidazole-4-carboxamide isomerase [Desulfovibrionaceae bacterium]
MIVFPAVDIQKGQAVRLRQGLAEEATVFADNPVDAAIRWEREGARWLHVVDLDGAFAGDARSFDIVRAIASAVTIPIQLGGGIRNATIAARYLEAGITRLIIGTMALEEPSAFAELCQAFPGAIGVSLDAVEGKLKTRGWLGASDCTLDDVLPRLAHDGAAFIIYTDISRDGMQKGANLDVLRSLSRKSPIPLIAAGGIATLADIQALYPLSVSGALCGVISGRALYEGTLSLKEAMAWIDQQEKKADV